jgi:hypothetical protein
MAKTGVTEDDLLKGAGGFDAFNRLGTGKPVRDNPFRDTRVHVAEQTVQAVQPATDGAAALVQEQPKVVPQALQAAPQKPKVEVLSLAKPVAEISSAPLAREVVTKEVEKKDLKKDKFPEKVTTFVTTKMRDDLLRESRKLNSRRLVKGDPLTSNTLIRCGIKVVTELIDFAETDVVSSEEELFALIKKKLKA